ncbi:hypothetical protein ODS41_04240 [Pyrobaculum sp. 3827-6]|mgnify:CR=1 FL=1|uniref:Uncharacterized protein n=1 Tax=Pyrobaculum ferrireducens TaxID=1104324 RepID=G7VCY2_9CREN|nr:MULTISPECIES: hypothetical protein [Pyrobaculum]AET32671.1 hypothetical protein P186_1242 [Pyrobaculum ferrireducens]MCU7787134.1 hypothetical protein [Pyrobaculum sp. 3827-6]
MEKFRTIVGEKKEEPRQEVAQAVQEPRPKPETTAIQEIAAVARESTDVGQFMRYVASTIAKLPPEERTFVRFLIAPKATPLVINDRMIDVIFKNIDLLEEPHIEALSKSMSPEDLVKLADRFNNKLAALVAIFAEKCRPAPQP